VGVVQVSDPQSTLPPAGWYPDPSGAPQQRWWDGQGWTVHYQGAATAPVAPVAIVAPVSAPVQAPANTAYYQPAQTAVAPTLATAPGPASAQAARGASVDELIAPTGVRALEASSVFPLAATPLSPAVAASPAVPATVPAAVPFAASVFAATPASAVGSAPSTTGSIAVAPATTGFDFTFGAAPGAASGAPAEPFGITNFAGLGQASTASVLSYDVAPTTWSTRSGWLLALLPLVQLAITGGMFYLWINVGLAPIAVILLSMLPAVLSLAAAVSDQRKLRELGFDRPPSWGWIFLGPWLYLILRVVATRREIGAGAALIWVWLASSILASIVGTAATLYVSTLAAS